MRTPQVGDDVFRFMEGQWAVVEVKDHSVILENGEELPISEISFFDRDGILRGNRVVWER